MGRFTTLKDSDTVHHLAREKQMNTLDRLQAHLKTPIKYGHKDLAPRVECVDGFTMSVQASKFHYCTSRSDIGPYTTVEVHHCGSIPEWEEFSDNGNGPYAYLPIDLVVAKIELHGGFKETSP